MRLVTDVPTDAAPLLAPGGAWSPLAAGDLEPASAARWGDLAGSATGWWADVAGPPERTLLVVGRAPASQFDRLNAWLAEGAAVPEGLACVALEGARFHGQRGRPWTALRGNLHLSVHLPLDLDAAAAQAGLTALPAVATARAIERATAGRVAPRLKWVNDVLVAERKVAGVLVATQLQGARVRHGVVGIGANVGRAPELPPGPRVVPATALAAHDPAFAELHGTSGWAALLRPLLEELEHGRALLQAGRGAELVDAYRERTAFLGRVATIWPVDDADAPPIARGRVLDLLPDLSLLLEGRAHPVRAGRMTLEPGG